MSEYGKLFAAIYDPVVYPFLTHIRKHTAQIIKQTNAKKIIDLCCGTGNQLKHLKKNGLTDIIGIDISPFMIEKARKGKITVECELKDATNTEFPSNTFDLAMVSFALHEMPWQNAEKIINEAFRIIKPGGFFLAIDYCITSKPSVLGRIGRNLIERLAGKEHYNNYKYFIKHGGLAELLKQKKLIKQSLFLFKAVAVNLYQK